MESKYLKLVLIALCCLGYTSKAISQKSDSPDRFRFHGEIAISALSYKLSGIDDVGSGNVSILKSKEVVQDPEYELVEKRAFSTGLKFRIGFNIPFYRAPKWSIGIKNNIGAGYQYGILAEGLSSIAIDAPQFLYFRSYNENHDYSFMMGYNYCLSSISHQVFLLGFDINEGERTAFRFFLSPIRRVYYSELTNGDLVPAIKVTELGISFVF
jgi:hypothetical protein